jgi:hypothetical protein
MRYPQGMKATAALLAGAFLASASARADQAIGLREDDLQAIRTANREKPDWLPILSKPFHSVLINRPHEAVQVIIEPDGRFFYRGPDSQFLTVPPPPYTADDHKKLTAAIQTSYYRATLDIVQGRSAYSSQRQFTFSFQPDSQRYLSAIRNWDEHVGQTVTDEAERRSLHSLLGSTVLELPEYSQRKVIENIGEEAKEAVMRARALEGHKLKAINEADVIMAPLPAVRQLAGELSHLTTGPVGPAPIELRVHKKDSRVFSVTLEPGKQAYFKADSPDAAKDLAATISLSKLAEMADTGKVAVYVDQGPGKGIEQVGGNALREQLKAVQGNKK